MNRWTLAYEGFDPAEQGLRETLCTIGNGYFATRGAPTFAAADGIHYPGTYLAGGYNRLESVVSDRTIENEDLVNLPNWLPLVIRIGDGPWLHAGEWDFLEHVQELDLKEGLLHRRFRLSDLDGRIVTWREQRLVSMACPHLAALRVQITPENWSGQLTIRSALDGSVTNCGVERYRELAGKHHETIDMSEVDDETIMLRARFVQSHREVVVAARTRVASEHPQEGVERRLDQTESEIAHVLSFDARAGEEITLEKTVALYTSCDFAISEPALTATAELAHAGDFVSMAQAHERAWDNLWSVFDIGIDTSADHETETKLRLHIFHLLQTASPHCIDLDVGVPARGWHGEAYRGHIFWDELFIFPFINLRMPMITRALLLYRHRRLPEARRAARRAGYAGAMFPWQSGSSGREETQSLHLNPLSGRWLPDVTHRQRHVNAAIVYNVWQYFQVTEDFEFLVTYGAELMLEIVRFWISLAEYDATRERYVIRGVIGPDEFHTAEAEKPSDAEFGIANNAYTNVLVAWCITRALDVLDLLSESHRHRVCTSLGIAQTDLQHWDEVSRSLFVPFHGDGIISQFEGYETLEELDCAHYAQKYGNLQRLDRILEAEGDHANRYKVSKQADVLMLFFLFSTEELKEIFDRLGCEFTPDMIGRNIEYYSARTSHGSTLSLVTHAWILSRWDRRRSWNLFQTALNADFQDLQGGTTAEGIHLGAMAGSVDLVQRCYTGLEVRANMLSFNPLLPEELQQLRATFHYRGHTLDVTVSHYELEVASRQCMAQPITIAYRGHVRGMSPGQTYRFRLIRPAEKKPMEPSPGGPLSAAMSGPSSDQEAVA
ncbi:MAG: glycoside hydrolase family 65 protein [Hyphomicrobiaceae bacterium]